MSEIKKKKIYNYNELINMVDIKYKGDKVEKMLEILEGLGDLKYIYEHSKSGTKYFVLK